MPVYVVLSTRARGEDFDAPELKDLFKWSSGEMTTYYLSGQKLANKMGIKRLPS